MNDRLIDLALKKQRLQLKSEALRAEWIVCAGALRPLCGGADRVRLAGAWLRRHPEAVAAGAVALAVARPRAVFRWLRRSFFAVRLWRRVRGWLAVG